MTWLWHLLGFDYGLPYGHVGAYNVWSGFLGDVSIVGGIATGLRVMVKNHRQRLAQAALHQKQLLDQNAEQHKVHMDLLRRHHVQVLDAAAPVSVSVAPPADPVKIAAQLKDNVQKLSKPGGGM